MHTQPLAGKALRKHAKRTIRLTSLDRRILHLAVPSILSNVTVPLIGLVDLTISGHLGQVEHIGAIAVGTMAFNILYWLFGFLRMGTSGLTAQALGARRLDEVVRLLIRALLVSLAVALLILIFRTPLRDLMLLTLQPSVRVAPLATQYFDIVVWGAPAMLCQYGLTGWYIGMQNTRTPMFVVISQNVLNVVTSPLLAFGCDMGLRGVAWGTLLSQWLGLMLAVAVWLSHYSRLLRYDRRSSLLDHRALRMFFSINRDIFLRTLCIIAVNFFFLAAGAQSGDLVLSANAVLMTFFTIFSYFMDGFAYAAEALSGRLHGAHNATAFHNIIHRLFCWGWGMVSLFSLLYIIGGHPFLHLLTDQHAVILVAGRFFCWVLLIPLAGFAAFIYDGIFIGITATRGMLVSSVLSAALFFLLYFLLRGTLDNHALWISLLCYLFARGVFLHFLLPKVCAVSAFPSA